MILEYIQRNPVKTGVYASVSVLALTLVLGSFFSVKDYETVVVTRFGRVQGTYTSGFHFKLPYLDSVYTANHKLESKSLTLSTYVRDGSNSVEIKFDYSYRLNRGDVTVRNTFTNFGVYFDFATFLDERISNATRDIVSNYEITEVNNKRGVLKDKVVEAVNADVSQYGIKLETMSVGIEYGESYKTRLDAVKIAQARTAEEKQKTEQAEQQSKREIVEKETESKLAKIEADKNRYMVETKAEAEANSLTMQSIAEADATARAGEAKAKAIMAENNALKTVDGLIEFKRVEAELKRAEAMSNWTGGVPQQIIQGSGGTLPVFPFLDAMRGVK